MAGAQPATLRALLEALSDREPGLAATVRATTRARQDADARPLLVLGRARESLDEAAAMADERAVALDTQRPAGWPNPEPGWQEAQAAVLLPDVADVWSFEAVALEDAIDSALEAAALVGVPRHLQSWGTLERAKDVLARRRERWEGRYAVEPPDPLPRAVIAGIRGAVDSIGAYRGRQAGGRRKGKARRQTRRRAASTMSAQHRCRRSAESPMPPRSRRS